MTINASLPYPSLVENVPLPRCGKGELPCSACLQPGTLEREDGRGYLIAHAGRMFPCRVSQIH